jgi:hypothetical protein
MTSGKSEKKLTALSEYNGNVRIFIAASANTITKYNLLYEPLQAWWVGVL